MSNTLTEGINAFGSELFLSLTKDNQGKNVFISPPTVLSGLSMIGLKPHLSNGTVLSEDVDTMLYDFINLKGSTRNIKTNDIRMNVKLIEDESTTMNDLSKGTTQTFSVTEKNDITRSTASKSRKRVLTSQLSNDGLVVKTGFKKLLIASSFFNGAWIKPFDRSQTEKMTFYNHGNNKCPVTIDFISRWNHAYDVLKPHPYAYGLKASTIKIPLKNGLSLIIFMPTTNDDMDQLLNVFDSNFVDEQLEDLNFMSLKVVSIPKFNLCSQYDLAQPLCNLGINVTESCEAECLMSSATINIDEEGSEGIPPKEVFIVKNRESMKPSMVVDRPFIFLVRDHAGLNLFCGKIDCF